MGMTKQQLVDELTGLTEPSRLADQNIALYFKCRRETSFTTPRSNNPPRRKITWYDPSGIAFKELPSFTEGIDDAKSLCDMIMPSKPAGFSFHDGYAQAVVDGGEPVQAFNIATALCLATIQAAPDASE